MFSRTAAEYKPQPIILRDDYGFPQNSKKKGPGCGSVELDQTLFSAKKDRCKVFTGRRNTFLKEVPSLYDSCIRVLCDNIDGLGYTGGVPFDILKPILERATAEQLFRIEDLNPYLSEDTDSLWAALCKRDFKSAQREELECWREVYERLFEERERRLEQIRSTIGAANKKAQCAARQTILSLAKAPRDVKRKQEKFGTGRLPVATAQEVLENKRIIDANLGSSSSSSNSAKKSIVQHSSNGGSFSTFGGESTTSSSSSNSSKKRKPVAPLMAKTLKMMKRARR